jgi:type IV pilus assembly protein PilC
MNVQARILFVVIAIASIIVAVNTWIVVDESELAIVVAFVGIVAGAIFVAIRFALSRRRQTREPQIGESWLDLRLAGALLLLAIPIALFALVVAIGGLYDLAGALILVSVILSAVACLYFLYRLATVWIRRRTTDQVVIGTLAAVVRQNLPLATGLTLAAESEPSGARIHLYRIARLLTQGCTLGEATRRGFPDCPSLPLSLIIAGERAGQLTAALDQAEGVLVERARRRDRADVSVWPYMLCLMAFTILVVSGVMIALIPKFKEIFKDFETQLPSSTRQLISAAEFVVADVTLPVLLFVAVLAIPIAMYLSVRPRRVPDLAWTSRIADWIRWQIPGWHRMQFASGMTAVLRTVLLGVRAGMNLEPAVRLAADVDVNHQLRPRIRHFAQLLSAGTDVRAAAKEAGLGEVTAVALAGAQRSGNLEPGLRFAAEYYDALVSRFYLVIRTLAWPLGTLIMAAFIGMVVVALFQPLVTLINSVTWWG